MAIENNKISLCMVVYEQPDMVRRAVESVKQIVDEIIIVDQGSSLESYEKISALADYAVQTTNKGNADYDRQYCYGMAKHPFILALDSDEVITTDQLLRIRKLFLYNFDICWFLFKNEVEYKGKIVDLKDILGEDPHPRLWRKALPDGSPTIEWQMVAHKYPKMASARQIFSQVRFRHRRQLPIIIETHLRRSKNIEPEGKATEIKFISTLLDRFGNETATEMKAQFPELTRYVKGTT